jgi:predicted ATPase
MQQGLGDHVWTSDEQVRVRMGLHTGEAAATPTGLVGLDVHKAARIAAVGHGGQVLVSEACAAIVRDRLPGGVSLRSLGSHRLKDLTRAEEICQLEAEGLESDFPPLKSLDDPLLKHNLPVQLTSFVGRASELAEVSHLVRTERLVTLTGPGGTGKTRLALQAASGLLDGAGGGAWFVDLSPIFDQDLVAATVAAVLQVNEAGIQQALSTRHLLIVLDNCEHLIDACAKFVDGLLRACPNVHVLATSREPLAIDGEHIYVVPPLTLGAADVPLYAAYESDAVQLFGDRAQAHSRTFVLDDASLPIVISICQRLDGSPLALELVAARLRTLSLAEIELGLEDRFRLVAGGKRTAPARHQTLRATMDWSYESLNQRDRAVFDRLSVFAGGFDLRLAESVGICEHAEPHVIVDAVSSLVDKSLVNHDVSTEGRYRLNETSRDYAAERLAKDPAALAATLNGHAMALLELAEKWGALFHGADQDAAVARLEAERANLRAASGHLLATPRTKSEALRFATALRDFWLKTATPREGLEFIEKALDEPGVVDPLVEASADASAARLFLAFDDCDRAARYVEEGLRLIAEGADDRVLAQLLRCMGYVEGGRGDLGAAFRAFDGSIDAARRIGDEFELSASLNARGIEKEKADPEGALQDYAEAIACCERSGDYHGVGRILINAGFVEMDRNDVAAAHRHWERGLERADLSAAIALRANLAGLALRRGDVVTAAGLILQNLEAIKINPVGHGYVALRQSALCLSAVQEDDQAVRLHAAAIALGASGPYISIYDEAMDSFEMEVARLRQALGEDAFDRAGNAELNWEEAHRLATTRLSLIIARSESSRPGA